MVQVEFNITTFDLAGNNHNSKPNESKLSKPHNRQNIPTVSNLSMYSNNSNSSLAIW